MTKQELLTKLAIKCSTWAVARSDITWHNYQVSDEEALQIDEEEWLAERGRLLSRSSGEQQ